MEMLHGMNALEALPILEPDDVLGRHMRMEGFLDIGLDLFPRLVREITSGRIVLKLEFCPDDEVHDLVVDTIRPVVVEYFDIICSRISVPDFVEVILGHQSLLIPYQQS